MNKLLRWLEDHTPVICAICHRIVFAKNIRRRETMTGWIVPLCSACDDEWFCND